MNKDECIFCTLYDSPQRENVEIYDTVLYETDSFLVYPALGSLVEGYLLVVTKKHVPSMAYLDKATFDELEKLIEYVRTRIKSIYGKDIICFEHGGTEHSQNKAACCINHAHIHLVPIDLQDEEYIIEQICASEMNSFEKLRDYSGIPYIFYMNEGLNCYISADVIAISQYMRRWIAHQLLIPEQYDWRRYHFIDNIRKTVEAWNQTT